MKHPDNRTVVKPSFKKCIHKNTSFRKLHVISYSWESNKLSASFFTSSFYMNIKFKFIFNLSEWWKFNSE